MFYYVYILTCEADPGLHYTGFTTDLDERLASHNAGKVTHTAERNPWRIETAIAFLDREKALAFEKYLKSHSGRAFATRHF